MVDVEPVATLTMKGSLSLAGQYCPTISAATDLGVLDLSLSLPCDIDAPNSDAPIMTMTCQPECRSRLLFAADSTDCFPLVV